MAHMSNSHLGTDMDMPIKNVAQLIAIPEPLLVHKAEGHPVTKKQKAHSKQIRRDRVNAKLQIHQHAPGMHEPFSSPLLDQRKTTRLINEFKRRAHTSRDTPVPPQDKTRMKVASLSRGRKYGSCGALWVQFA
jgi:hypothetical protein